jgi:hypothetical protein
MIFSLVYLANLRQVQCILPLNNGMTNYGGRAVACVEALSRPFSEGNPQQLLSESDIDTEGLAEFVAAVPPLRLSVHQNSERNYS